MVEWKDTTRRPRPGGWPHKLPRELLYELPDVPDGEASYTRRLADVLAEGIASRVFRQGQRMPSALQIAARFRVSVDTGRLAVNLLAERGLVRRAPDKGGAYVCGVELGAPNRAAHL